MSVLLDVQANLLKTSSSFVCPICFGEHLFSNVNIVLVMCNFGSYRKTLTQAFDISKRVKGRFSFSFVHFYEIIVEFFRI